MTQRDRIVMMVVIAVVALGGFWMFALKPQRKEAASLGQELAQAQQRVNTARTEVSAGDAARTRYANNYATVARLGKAVPVEDDVPSLIYQLDSTAKETGVDFRTVKLTSGAAAPVSAPTAAQGAAATADASANKTAAQTPQSAGAGAAPSNGSSPAAGSQPPPVTAPTQAATAALPPGATVGQAGLSTMPFNFTFEGSFFKLTNFMTKLERYIKASKNNVDVRGRLLMINGFSLAAAPQGFPMMKASVSAQAYLLPVDQGLFNGASPTGPSAVTSEPAVSNAPGAPPVAPAAVTP